MATDTYTQNLASKLHAAEYICASRLLYFYRPTTPDSTWYAFERMRYFIAARPPEKQDELWDALFASLKIGLEVHRILSALPRWRLPVIRAVVDRQPWHERVSIAQIAVAVEQHRYKRLRHRMVRKRRRGWSG